MKLLDLVRHSQTVATIVVEDAFVLACAATARRLKRELKALRGN